MSKEINVENKKGILEEDFEIEMTREVESEVSYMCNYSDGIWMKGMEKGIEEGMEKGRAEGRVEGIEKGRAEGRADVIAELRKLGFDAEAFFKEHADKA